LGAIDIGFDRETEERNAMGEGAIAVRSLNPETMPRTFGFSQVVEVSGGRTVYVSGQVPLDRDNELVGAGDFRAQARQAFENVRLALDAVGMTFANVVKMQVNPPYVLNRRRIGLWPRF
jgi:enamine deaminase RidA (YjgF/YER057c/UK114 family)